MDFQAIFSRKNFFSCPVSKGFKYLKCGFETWFLQALSNDLKHGFYRLLADACLGLFLEFFYIPLIKIGFFCAFLCCEISNREGEDGRLSLSRKYLIGWEAGRLPYAFNQVLIVFSERGLMRSKSVRVILTLTFLPDQGLSVKYTLASLTPNFCSFFVTFLIRDFSSFGVIF